MFSILFYFPKRKGNLFFFFKCIYNFFSFIIRYHSSISKMRESIIEVMTTGELDSGPTKIRVRISIHRISWERKLIFYFLTN
jgi:hypothetical protein